MPSFPITRVDATQRMVYARLDETPDSAGHIMDYATSKPNFLAWSESMAKASGGLNLGNVRAMHSNVAAGMVKEIACDDDTKTILFGIQVTNDREWENCLSGLYTGISPGGRMRKWADGAYHRFEARPDELSMVDRPANPNATFIMVKAAGIEETRHFAPADDVDAILEDMSKAASPADLAGLVMSFPTTTVVRLFGNEGERAPDEPMLKRYVSAAGRREMGTSGEAMPDGSFPIASQDDLQAAIQSVGRAKDENAAKAHVIARATALGAANLLPADWRGAEGPMKKGLDEVGCIARILGDIGWLARWTTSEAAAEGDGSQIPAQLVAWLRDGMAIMTAMATEESAELVTSVQADVAQLPGFDAAVAAADAVLDAADPMTDDTDDVMTKAAAWPRVVAMTAELATAREEMRKFAGERARFETDRGKLQARIKELEALPAPGGPRLRAITKETDGVPPSAADTKRAEVAAMPPGRERALAEMRDALSIPITFSNARTAP